MWGLFGIGIPATTRPDVSSFQGLSVIGRTDDDADDNDDVVLRPENPSQSLLLLLLCIILYWRRYVLNLCCLYHHHHLYLGEDGDADSTQDAPDDNGQWIRELIYSGE